MKTSKNRLKQLKMGENIKNGQKRLKMNENVHKYM